MARSLSERMPRSETPHSAPEQRPNNERKPDTAQNRGDAIANSFFDSISKRAESLAKRVMSAFGTVDKGLDKAGVLSKKAIGAASMGAEGAYRTAQAGGEMLRAIPAGAKGIVRQTYEDALKAPVEAAHDIINPRGKIDGEALGNIEIKIMEVQESIRNTPAGDGRDVLIMHLEALEKGKQQILTPARLSIRAAHALEEAIQNKFDDLSDAVQEVGPQLEREKKEYIAIVNEVAENAPEKIKVLLMGMSDAKKIAFGAAMQIGGVGTEMLSEALNAEENVEMLIKLLKGGLNLPLDLANFMLKIARSKPGKFAIDAAKQTAKSGLITAGVLGAGTAVAGGIAAAGLTAGALATAAGAVVIPTVAVGVAAYGTAKAVQKGAQASAHGLDIVGNKGVEAIDEVGSRISKARTGLENDLQREGQKVYNIANDAQRNAEDRVNEAKTGARADISRAGKKLYTNVNRATDPLRRVADTIEQAPQEIKNKVKKADDAFNAIAQKGAERITMFERMARAAGSVLGNTFNELRKIFLGDKKQNGTPAERQTANNVEKALVCLEDIKEVENDLAA